MSTWQINNPNWTRDAVITQFGEQGGHAEFYRMLRAVDRDLYLNSGYSGPGRRHWSRASQLRLVDRLARRLFRRGPRPIQLLDVGCGRGGPAFRANEKWDADVKGVDLCPYNIDRAIETTRQRSIHEGLHFRKGDALNLPFSEASFPYCWAIESTSYLPDKSAFFDEVVRVLAPGGRFCLADVAVNEGVVSDSRLALDALGRFLSAWDMPYIESLTAYENRLKDAGFHVVRLEDATHRTLGPHGKRLRRLIRVWESQFAYRLTRWFIRKKTDTDLDAMREQLEATSEAIEIGVLRYGLIWCEKPSG